jgi:hypothetical protein
MWFGSLKELNDNKQQISNFFLNLGSKLNKIKHVLESIDPYTMLLMVSRSVNPIANQNLLSLLLKT